MLFQVHVQILPGPLVFLQKDVQIEVGDIGLLDMTAGLSFEAQLEKSLATSHPLGVTDFPTVIHSAA